MILKDIYFFQNSSQTGDSAILSNESKGDTLSIQIDCSGSFTLSVQGCLDIESGIYQKVFATNMATNKRTDSLTQEGLYQVDVDGYRRIKLVLESIGGSPITAYGVMKEESGKIDVEDDVATKEYVEEYVDEAIAPKEDKTNKVTSLSSESTDTQYPSAKCVYDLFESLDITKREIVQELPTQDISTKTIYMVPKNPSGEDNYYTEYMYINNNWEKIGDTEIDLSGYQTLMQYSTVPTASVDVLGKIIQYTGTTTSNYTNGYYYMCISNGEATPTYSWERINVQPNQDLSGYVTFTDYATSSVAGVIKPYAGLLVNTSNGNAYCEERTYQQYQDGGSTAFISKGTLENVITGKNLVSNTDYASESVAGVIKPFSDFATAVNDNGRLYARVDTYENYNSRPNTSFVGKGTLENVITGKNLETANNKVTSLSASSTDTQYPSAKAVYDTITDKISSVYRYKGSVADYAHLPSTDLTVGDVYNIEAADPTHEISAGDNVAWTGTVWDKLSGTVDLSGYQTKIDSSHKLSSDLVDDTGNTNLFVTSSEKSTWSGKQDALTAGDNITISGNTISATDTTYDDATTSVSGLMSSTDKTKLDGIATGAEVNVQANWNETDTDSDAYIQNKPTIPDELSDLADDSTHRLVTDAEKSTWNGKQDIIQYSTMPVASEELEGKIVQYIGDSTLDYTNGYFYICESVGGEYITYKWTDIYVQTPPDLSRFLAKDNTTAYTPTGDYNPATKLYVDSGLSNKQDSLVSGTNIKTVNGSSVLGAGDIVTEQIQYSSVPTASAANLGKVIQYIGVTSANYTNGYFYKCIDDGGNYVWAVSPTQLVDVEPCTNADIDNLFN